MDWYRILPLYWFQNSATCPLWDKALNEALGRYPVENVTGYSCSVGPLKVWIANWPYAYGSDQNGSSEELLPKVATRKRLKKAVDAVYRERRLAYYQHLMEKMK